MVAKKNQSESMRAELSVSLMGEMYTMFGFDFWEEGVTFSAFPAGGGSTAIPVQILCYFPFLQ